MKAYTTRVGEGPFPTELLDDQGTLLRETGREFGATTGRPRRCGWFDAVATRYSVMVNGIDELAVTKLDVLDALPKIKVCVAYKVGGKVYETVPNDIDVLERCTPVYQEFDGWQTSTKARAGLRPTAEARAHLPAEAGAAQRREAQHRVGRRAAGRDDISVRAQV